MRPRPGGGRISAPPPADWQRDRRAFEREPRRPRAVNSGPIRRIFGRPQPKLHHPPRCLEPRRQMTRRRRNPAANSRGCKGGRRPSRSGPAAPNVAPIARNPRGEISARRSNVPRRPRGADLRGQDPAVHLAASSRPPPRSTASSKPPGVGVAPEAGAASHPRGGSSKAAMGKPWEAGGRGGWPPEAQVPQRGVRGERRGGREAQGYPEPEGRATPSPQSPPLPPPRTRGERAPPGARASVCVCVCDSVLQTLGQRQDVSNPPN